MTGQESHIPITASTVYLIPSLLAEGATDCLPLYLADAVKNCQVFFVERERSARRFCKLLWKEMVIDDYSWIELDKNDPSSPAVLNAFRKAMQEKKNIGIISEAGCPGIADPGQVLVEAAHRAHAKVKPLVGPNALLLALMASGMNGQQFRFTGYLPIDTRLRQKAIREFESDSQTNQCTILFIETPYRNNQLLQALIQTCQDKTRLCIAADLTSSGEFIQTKTIAEWKTALPNIHKRPAIFCLHAG
jgi:16S rRNA (cytidine1402-2'-O)-methyltransferase